MLSWLAVILIGAFVAVNIGLYFAQGRIVFYPSRDFGATPRDAGIAAEDVFIEVVPGQRIHAWYVPPPEPAAPVVLFCHGNAGNISHRLETLRFLVDLGAGVLLFDYRGYGRSEGAPGEREVYADADACYEWLRRERSVAPDRIVAFGRSLGGAVAVELASRRPCRGLIVESSFTSIEDMGRKMYRYLPVRWFLRFSFRSIDRIGAVACPVLVTHSPDDELVPYEMGQRLAAAARPPKRFVPLVGGHNTLEYFALEPYRAAVRDILSGAAREW
ncbi:MAG TPA: alpha/beta hydrolase [candidate division Zixibacteria bacterium]|nr:alpha/beta hydrolase [candidate division Zixibacteria bacterium]MDM7973668.1 alpha/beta hydrolase [candidate division Zixibacteria bacterium]HOZ07146.1 alpha/beta hydrolase [candidate division Zixibacteria bacterium]HPM37592.1 alpha/beta hydrolase [candidate division Zixibacteria bacterium]